MNLFKSTSKTYSLFFLGILIIFGAIAWQPLPWFQWSDGCEHAATVMELTHSLKNPKNPFLDLPGDTSPRFVPSIMFMAVLQKAFSLDVFVVLGLMSTLVFIFLGWGVYLFSKEFFNDAQQAIYVLLCILFLWGKGWDGANGFMFSSLVFNAYYPSVVSFVGIFFALTLLLKYIRRGGGGIFWGFVALSCLILLNHPITGGYFFIIAAVLVATEGYQSKKSLYLFAFSFLAAVIVSVIWPYHPFLQSVFFIAAGKGKQFWEYNQAHNWLYSEHIIRVGPGFLGVIPLAYFGLKREYRFLTYGFLVFFILYVLGYIFHIILFERGIFYCMLFSQLAFARLLKKFIDAPEGISGKVVWKNVKIFFIAALAVGTATQLFLVSRVYLPQWVEFKPNIRMKAYEHPLRHYIELRPYLHRGDIVLTDIFTSWILPCITEVKVVSLLHNIPLFLENIERVQDTRDFFLSPREQINILKKYRVSHILIDKTKSPQSEPETETAHCFIPQPNEQLLAVLSELGSVVINDESFLLVDVRNLF